MTQSSANPLRTAETVRRREPQSRLFGEATWTSVVIRWLGVFLRAIFRMAQARLRALAPDLPIAGDAKCRVSLHMVRGGSAPPGEAASCA